MSQETSIHLLRACLREASYLPDATARTYFRRYIVNRFRAYQPKKNASPTIHAHTVEKKLHRFGKRREMAIIEGRTRAMQGKASKGLNLLRRANNGEHKCLQKILYFTYGRMGKRKYALLEHLLRPDDPTAVTEPSPLQKLYYSNERCLSFFDAPKKSKPTHYNIEISNRYAKLKATVKAQLQNGAALGREIKRPHLLMPINNVWMRPMPIKRARNYVRNWYAETMTRLLPPLPNEEFDDLQAMVNGTKKISLVKRRSPAVELQPAEHVPEVDRFANMVQEALVLAKPSKAERRTRADRPLHRTAHFMKRLYASLLTHCSKLEWNHEFKRWESVWGSRLRGTHSLVGAVDDHLFAGVDAKGKLLVEEKPITKKQGKGR